MTRLDAAKAIATRGILFLALILTAGCSSPAAESDTPSSAPASEAAAVPSVAGLDIAAICAQTTYGNCSASLRTAAEVCSGELVAICEYPDGIGDVVTTATEADAEEECSGGGLIEGSRVVTVLELP
ncbi:MAG: hypothetical protein M3406_01060 [Chloroflexota bacterium]|nr:hypothetical protein [Chloroflexota bacterium]